MKQPSLPHPLKIVLCGSTVHYDQMQSIQQRLEAAGFQVQLPPEQVTGPSGRLMPQQEFYLRRQAAGPRDPWVWDAKALAMRTHDIKIGWADAILVVNGPKHGQPNYIGANTFADMNVAFSLGKPVFVLGELPDQHPQLEELRGIQPVQLRGNLDPSYLRSAYIESLTHPPVDSQILEHVREEVYGYGQAPPACPGRSASVLVYRVVDGAKQILLQRRRKFPAGWAPSAGHVKPGAMPRHTAREEALEEVGLHVDDERLTAVITDEPFPSPCRRGSSSHRWHVFTLEVPEDTEVGINAAESHDYGWFDLDQLQQLSERTNAYLKTHGAVREEADETPAWRADPGLEPVWCFMLHRLGYITI